MIESEKLKKLPYHLGGLGNFKRYDEILTTKHDMILKDTSPYMNMVQH